MHSTLTFSALLLPLVSSMAIPEQQTQRITIPITTTITKMKPMATPHDARRGVTFPFESDISTQDSSPLGNYVKRDGCTWDRHPLCKGYPVPQQWPMTCTYEKESRNKSYEFEWDWAPMWKGTNGAAVGIQKDFVKENLELACDGMTVTELDFNAHRHGDDAGKATIGLEFYLLKNSTAVVPTCVENGMMAAGGPEANCVEDDKLKLRG